MTCVNLPYFTLSHRPLVSCFPPFHSKGKCAATKVSCNWVCGLLFYAVLSRCQLPTTKHPPQQAPATSHLSRDLYSPSSYHQRLTLLLIPLFVYRSELFTPFTIACTSDRVDSCLARICKLIDGVTHRNLPYPCEDMGVGNPTSAAVRPIFL